MSLRPEEDSDQHRVVKLDNEFWEDIENLLRDSRQRIMAAPPVGVKALSNSELIGLIDFKKTYSLVRNGMDYKMAKAVVSFKRNYRVYVATSKSQADRV